MCINWGVYAYRLRGVCVSFKGCITSGGLIKSANNRNWRDCVDHLYLGSIIDAELGIS